MGDECPVCEQSATKQCAGCRKVRYCSEKCQRSHWKRHIFDCKRDPLKPILTAYRLYLAVLGNTFPEDLATIHDYGFKNAHTLENRSNLLGLYTDLINHLNIEPINIHYWRKKGTLVQEIENAYQELAPSARGEYYPWFLENQHLLDTAWQPPHDAHKAGILQTWRFIGGKDSDTFEEHRAIYDVWTNAKQICFLLYHILRSGWRPIPDQTQWLDFGFATCRTQFDESDLAVVYKVVILEGKCTLDDFTVAFQNHDLLTLFRQYGVADRVLKIPYMKEFLDGRGIKSVWFLKEYVYQELGDNRKNLAFRVDYGFINCNGVIEHLDLLKVTYKKVFEHPESDPLELHKACVTGKLFEYVDSLLKIKKKEAKLLKRLVKNPYPLAEF